MLFPPSASGYIFPPCIQSPEKSLAATAAKWRAVRVTLLVKHRIVYSYMSMKTLGADVLAAVEKIVMTEGARDEAIAREYVKRLRQKGRYSEDVWS